MAVGVSDFIRVLLIDKDQEQYQLIRILLSKVRDSTYDVEWEPDFDLGLKKIGEMQHDVCLLDYRFKGQTCLKCIQSLGEAGAFVPVVVLTDFVSPELEREAIQAGATDFLEKKQIGTQVLDRVIRFSIERNKARREEESRESRLRIQNNSLLELSKNPVLFQGDLEAALKEIARQAGEVLKVERVGVWFFNRDRTRMVNKILFEKSRGEFSRIDEFPESLYPLYFTASMERKTINVQERRTDPRTSELTDGDLAPLNIYSCLDAPIRFGGEMVGVICYESAEARRCWTLEDRQFSGAISDFITLSLEVEQRVRSEKRIQKINDVLANLTLDYDQSMDLLVYTCGEILECDGVLYQKLCEEMMYLSRSWKIPLSRDYSRKAEGLFCFEVFKERLAKEGFICHDFSQSPYRTTDFWVSSHGFQSGLCFPVKMFGSFLGPLTAFSVEPRFFGEEESKIIGIFANMIGRVEERRRRENALEEAKLRTERATELKDQFVSLVSHDLKSPLNSLMLSLQLMEVELEGRINAEQKEFLKDAMNSGWYMSKMIHELLNLSRVQLGKVKLNKQFFNARLLCDQAIRNLKGTSEKKKLKMVNEVPESLSLFGDSDLILEVIQNLLSNAIKFSFSENEIWILFIQNQQATIAVKDSGVGISKENRKKLFNPNKSFSTIGTLGEKGTGYGLAFCKEIMTLHGGNLSVDSEEGKGSTFLLEMPWVKPLVLLVDDEKEGRLVQARFLKKLGMEILEAGNGEEALSLVKENLPHLIVSDIAMPIMNGFTLLEKIKMNLETKQIPVIMITASADPESKWKSLQLGASDFLSKPVDLEDLALRIRKYVG